MLKTKNIEEYNRVFIEEPVCILEEVKYTLSLIDSASNFDIVEDSFNDIVKLFNGHFQGYQSSKTKYHDLNHTLSVFLATARLIHGAFIDGRTISRNNIIIGLISSLFHDIGLIQTENDLEGTGAKYIIDHEERSINFMKNYLKRNNIYKDHLTDCAHIIGCTIVGLSTDEIAFRSKETKLIGTIVGTADLLAQMADRLYLEKLIYLYSEFREGKVPGFESEFDLFKKTESFYEDISKKRLSEELGGVSNFMKIHFKHRFGVDRDYYQENIEKNIHYLKTTVLKYQNEYRQMLRRAGIIANLERVNN